MKLILILGTLLATYAIAIPSSSERNAARFERRRAGRQSLPNNRIVDNTFVPAATNGTNKVYSMNWAGAVWDNVPSGTFNSVTGTFTVPAPKAASGQSTGAAAAWVGIDGDTCSSAILQTGIDFTVINGVISYDAWYEWYPDYSYDFSGITIKAGDIITMTVTASTPKSGTVVIHNKTTGKTVTQSLTSTAALCKQNAEWIMEDYEENSSLVPFADFGSVTFSHAVATTNSGKTVGPSGATLMDIEQNNVVLTSSSTSSNELTISYV